MGYYHEIMQLIGTCVDALGVMIIVIGAAIATVRFLLGQRSDFNLAYRAYRQGLGRAPHSTPSTARQVPCRSTVH